MNKNSINLTNNPMKQMIMTIFLTDLKARIKANPENAIEFINTVLDKQEEIKNAKPLR